MFISNGILRINPQIRNLPVGEWWMILECCPEIGRYYRDMINKYYLGAFKVQTPAWNTHISVARNEEPQDKILWNNIDGKQIEFKYEQKMFNNEKYFWIPVNCDYLLDLREQLGLSRNPPLPLHLTVAIRA